MNNIKIFLGILLVLSASRLIPHPPNFTSLIALSFYIPALFGLRYIPVVILTFLITDLFIGFHSTIIFTWGSVILIGYTSRFLKNTLFTRLSGSLLGAVIFFVVTNFGVWASGLYGYSIDGFLLCFTLAIPFFAHTILSTAIYSVVIECLQYVNQLRLKANN